MHKLLLSILLVALMGCTDAGNPYVPETNYVDHSVVFSYVSEFNQMVANVVIRDLSKPVKINFDKNEVIFVGNILADADDGTLNTYLYEGILVLEPENISQENKVHNLFVVESGEEGNYFTVRSE